MLPSYVEMLLHTWGKDDITMSHQAGLTELCRLADCHCSIDQMALLHREIIILPAGG